VEQRCVRIGLAVLAGATALDGLNAVKVYLGVGKVRQQALLETALEQNARELLPAWAEFHQTNNRTKFLELENVLRHHITRQRLIGGWAVKESLQRILLNRTSRSLVSRR
jgi:hypothetical protein